MKVVVSSAGGEAGLVRWLDRRKVRACVRVGVRALARVPACVRVSVVVVVRRARAGCGA